MQRRSGIRPIRLICTEMTVSVTRPWRRNRGRGGVGGQERSHVHQNLARPSSHACPLEQRAHHRPDAPAFAQACLIYPRAAGRVQEGATVIKCKTSTSTIAHDFSSPTIPDLRAHRFPATIPQSSGFSFAVGGTGLTRRPGWFRTMRSASEPKVGGLLFSADRNVGGLAVAAQTAQQLRWKADLRRLRPGMPLDMEL